MVKNINWLHLVMVTVKEILENLCNQAKLVITGYNWSMCYLILSVIFGYNLTVFYSTFIIFDHFSPVFSLLKDFTRFIIYYLNITLIIMYISRTLYILLLIILSFTTLKLTNLFKINYNMVKTLFITII